MRKSKSSNYFSLPPKAVQEGKKLSDIYIEERRDKSKTNDNMLVSSSHESKAFKEENLSNDHALQEKCCSSDETRSNINDFEKLTREDLKKFIHEIPKTGMYANFDSFVQT